MIVAYSRPIALKIYHKILEIGVPVKPIYVAFGRLFLIILAEPIFIFPVSLSTEEILL